MGQGHTATIYPKTKVSSSASTPGALKAVDDCACHTEITNLFVFVSVAKARNKEAEVVFFHKMCMANIYFNI